MVDLDPITIEAMHSVVRVCAIAIFFGALLILGTMAQDRCERQHRRRLTRRMVLNNSRHCKDCGADSGGCAFCDECHRWLGGSD